MEALVYDFGTWLESIGVWAYVLAPLAMAFVSVLPFPAEFPAILNGMMFGPVLGTLFTWGGALAGAQISFELARKLGRPLAERFVPQKSLEKDRNDQDDEKRPQGPSHANPVPPESLVKTPEPGGYPRLEARAHVSLTAKKAPSSPVLHRSPLELSCLGIVLAVS